MADGKSAPSVGELVAGNYQILGTAGAGGMGVVYRALDLKLQRTVALKFLPPDINASERDKERFLKEARTASSLDHPNIGVIYGIEETADDCTFIAMACYEGQSLAQRIRSGPLSPAEAVDIAIQVLKGLEHAHLQGIEHRDVKPSNIMLTQQRLVKLVDFGLAHVSQQTASQTHGVSGTVAYMSPEQTLGRSIDCRADIWAAGIVVLEMLTGHNPFSRETIPATAFAILNEPPQLPDTMLPGLRHVVYRALSKDPARRYQSCAEMLHDLEAIRPELPASVPADPISEASNLKRAKESAELRRSRESASASAWALVPAKARWKPWALGFGAAILLGAAVLFIFPSTRRVFSPVAAGKTTDNARLQTVQHIAVLPFDNIGNDPANAVLAEGLMESLTSKLSNLDAENQSLWVLPSSVVRARKVTDPASALKDLGATLVVQGSILREDRHVHLTLNLIDTGQLHQIGSVALDDASGDLATLQDEAVSQLAKLMRVNASGGGSAGGSQVPLAYENYLKSLAYLQRYDKPGNIQLAISALKDATASDPHFALAFAQLGEAYRFDYMVNKNPKSLEEATANCRQALALDDRLPAAYVTLGRLHDQSGNRELAVQEFQHALVLDPRNADAMQGIGHAYENAGRIADAETSFRRAAAMRPDYWDGYNTLGNFYDRNQKYPEAIAAYKQAIDLTPDNAELYANLGATYLDVGDPRLVSLAEAALKKAIELGPSYAAYANLGWLYLKEKRYAEAAAYTQKAAQLNGSDYFVWGNLAACYEWLGDEAKSKAAMDKERELLEAAINAHRGNALAEGTLAAIYAEEKQRALALRHLETALALNPSAAGVLRCAADTYEILGDRTKAIDYVQQSLKAGMPLADIQSDKEISALLNDPKFKGKTK